MGNSASREIKIDLRGKKTGAFCAGGSILTTDRTDTKKTIKNDLKSCGFDTARSQVIFDTIISDRRQCWKGFYILQICSLPQYLPVNLYMEHCLLCGQSLLF